MSRFIRIVAPILFTVALATGGASTALAGNGAGDNQPINQSWCFDDGAIDYCFDVTGHAQYVTNGSKESVVATTRFHTAFYENDVYIGESVVNSVDKFAVKADGTYAQSTIWHTKSRVGDEVCSIQVVWKSAEFETVVDHFSGGCTAA